MIGEIYGIYGIYGLLLFGIVVGLIAWYKTNKNSKSFVANLEDVLNLKNINYNLLVESIIAKENELRILFEGNTKVFEAFRATIESIVISKDFMVENIQEVFEQAEDILFKILQVSNIEISDKQKEYLAVSLKAIVRNFRNDPKSAVKLMSVPVEQPRIVE